MKSLFLPAILQKKRAPLVQHKSLSTYVFFLISALFAVQFLTTGGILGYATDVTTNDLLRLTNERRKEIGLESLTINPDLSFAAQKKAEDMFENDYWAHTSPTGKEPWDFIRASGYEYLYAGENLAVDFAQSKSVVNAWYNSPSHKDNLLNENYSEIGFAVVNGELQGRDTTLVVQMFGKPRLAAPQLAENNNDGNNEIDIAEVEANKVPAQENLLEAPTIEDINIQEELNASGALAPVFEEYAPQEITDTDNGKVLNSNDVFSASKYIAIILGLFVSMSFAVDGYFVRRYGVLRISGHTILHVFVLLLAILGVWYTGIGIVI